MKERPLEPTDEAWWGDRWSFGFAVPDGSLTGLVRIGLLPNQDRVQYWAALTGKDRRPVVVHDDEVPLPQRAGSLEIRTEGLWAEHIVEQPFEQVTVGCEAFALRLDSADDLRQDPVVGERLPFGLDLEWETWPPGTEPRYVIEEDGSGTRYELPCEVHGLVLVADEEISLETTGARAHGWGVQPALFVPRLD
jgi:hypothetical protein